jgi:hypothetical protein
MYGIKDASYVSRALEKGYLSSEQEYVTKWTAAALYAGGSDTVRMIPGTDRLVMLTSNSFRVIGTLRSAGFDGVSRNSA